MENYKNLLSKLEEATFPDFSNLENMMHGDMPGDKISIQASHIEKASLVFPKLAQKLSTVFAQNPHCRAVISVCGGSGVGKSETASLLGEAFQRNGIGAYVLSGDNYPHRIPAQNDAERLRIFRVNGISGLVANGIYNAEIKETLKQLQEQDLDAAPSACDQYPWLAVYQKEGRKALSRYLGSAEELNFGELSHIISNFKQGASHLYLKRMGRTPLELWYDKVDVSEKNLLIIEWTHGNSDGFTGVDLPILLNSTPQETLEHRRSRNRDGAVDSPFVTMVLELEQGQLQAQAHKAAFIISKSGSLLSYQEYCQMMAQA